VCLLFIYGGGREIYCKLYCEIAWKMVCWKVKDVRNNIKISLSDVGCDCVKWIMFNEYVPMRDTVNTYCIFVGYCHLVRNVAG
jgi:hypothetical protein